MKTLSVTVVQEVLTEEAIAKLDAQEGTLFEDLTCDSGKTRENYQDLGMKIPASLLEKEKNFGKDQDLEDEDFDILFKSALFKLSDFKLVVDNEEDIFGSTIFLKGGITLTVQEQAYEIWEQIEWENRNSWVKFKNWLWHLKTNNFISLYFRRRKMNSKENLKKLGDEIKAQIDSDFSKHLKNNK